MIKIKPFLIATLLLTGFALPAVAQIGEARNNLSVGINGGVNLNSASFTPTIKQNSLMGITGGLTARYISEKYFAMICGAQVELNVSQRGGTNYLKQYHWTPTDMKSLRRTLLKLTPAK